MSPVSAEIWRHARGQLVLEEPLVMGILNVTPDSFADGGRFVAPGSDVPAVSVAIRRAGKLRDQGAHIIDVGGESTRPGAEPLDPERELARVVPVIRELAAQHPDAVISIDTRRATVAQAALAAGASIVNDVSGLADPQMAAVVARAGAGVVVGHLRGEPRTMQRSVRFADVLGEVSRELAQAVARARAAGVEAERIVVDPGIGFGKLAEHSAALTLGARSIRAAVGYPVLIGVSRKSVLGALLGPTALPPLDDRVLASVVAAVLAVEWGASAVRVHDVAETVAALRVRAGLHAGLARAQTAASE